MTQVVSKSIDKTLFRVKPAVKVKQETLFDFYKKAYPNRYQKLIQVWRWMYGTDYNNGKTPLVVTYKNRVIAHAGTIPFNVFVNGKIYTATWYIDLKVLSEYRRMGVASLIELEFMKLSEISVGLGYNRPAFLLHQKLGWKLGHDYNFIYFPLRLLDMPFIRRYHSLLRHKEVSSVLNKIHGFFVRALYSQNALPSNSIALLKASKSNIKEHFNTALSPVDEGDVLRDDDYYNWRIIKSPDNNAYRIFKIDKKDVSLLIKFNLFNIHKSIDILYISDIKKIKEVIAVISSLAIWASKNNFSFIRQLSPKGPLLDNIKRKLLPIYKNPGFVIYTKDPSLLSKLEKTIWNWQGLDSDFERI